MNENIVATGLYYYASDNITESRLAFRTQVGKDPTGYREEYMQNDDDGYLHAFGYSNEDMMNQELGHVVALEDKCVAFPNLWQHRVEPFELADPTTPGHRKILCFFLVDPWRKVHSTSDVPPQQREWYEDAMEGVIGHGTGTGDGAVEGAGDGGGGSGDDDDEGETRQVGAAPVVVVELTLTSDIL